MKDALQKENNDEQYITLNYTFTNSDGTLLGSSEQSGPFTFRVGKGDTLPGLEEHVIGHDMGTTLEFVIPAEKAYGTYNPELRKTIPSSAIPDDLTISEGQSLTINNERVLVSELTDDTITVDSNHPLAGVDLHFNATITEISNTPPVSLHQHNCGCGSACDCNH